MLEDKSASVIFAVMPSVFTHYERLRALIGSAEIGALEEKSSNIIKLIRNNYDVSLWKSLFFIFFFFLFAGDYTGRPVVVMNEAVCLDPPQIAYGPI